MAGKLHGATFSFLGNILELETNSFGLFDHLKKHFAMHVSEKRSGKTEKLTLIAKPPSTQKLGGLIRRFTSKVISEFYGEFLLLHGSAIAKGGKAKIFLGRSNSGKTTVSLFAGGQGYEIMTDEWCLVDKKNLKVVPFQRGMIGVSPYSVKFLRESGLMADKKYAPLSIIKNRERAIRSGDLSASGIRFSKKSYPIDKIYIFRSGNAPVVSYIRELFPFHGRQNSGEMAGNMRSFFYLLRRCGVEIIPSLDLRDSQKRKQIYKMLRSLLK